MELLSELKGCGEVIGLLGLFGRGGSPSSDNSYELSKLSKAKEDENRLKEKELQIKQFERYSDEEILEKYNNIDGNQEVENIFSVRGGVGNKVLHQSSSTSLVSESKDYINLVNELSRRMIIY